MQKLPWFAQPKALVSARFGLRHQNIMGKLDQRCAPTRPPLPRPLIGVCDEATPVRVTVIIKHPIVRCDNDMVARETGIGPEPKRCHVRRAIALQNRISENVAGAACEKDTIGQSPPHRRVVLRIIFGSNPVHGRIKTLHRIRNRSKAGAAVFDHLPTREWGNRNCKSFHVRYWG